MERNVKAIYVALYVGVLFVHVVLFSKPYWNSRTPVGWDSPFYVGLTKLILNKGVQGLLEETSYFHCYSLLSALIVSSGVLDAVSAEIILPLILGMLSVVLFAFLTWKWYRDLELSLCALFLASTSFSVIRLVTDLHRNLTAFVFMLATFTLLPNFIYGRSTRNRIVVLALLFLMVITHVETYVFSLFVFLIFLIVSVLAIKRLTLKQAALSFFLYASPAFLTLLLLLPSIDVLWANLQPEPVVIMLSSSTILENLFAVNIISVIIFLILLVVREFKQTVITFLKSGEHELANTLLLCWTSFTIFAALSPTLRIPVPPLRVLLVSPVTIWMAICLVSLLRVIKKSKRRTAKTIHWSYRPFIVIGVSIIIFNMILANHFVNSYMRPFISSSTFERLRTLEKHNFSSKPIVVFYFKAGEDTKYLSQEYKLWLTATIGDHLSYFGKLNFMIADKAMPFEDPFLNETSSLIWRAYENDKPNIQNQEVFILPGEFYPSLSPYEIDMLNQISPGIYTLKNDFQKCQNFTSMRLMAFRDYYSVSNNWYVANYTWASEGLVAEYYKELPQTPFSIDFYFPISIGGVYRVRARMHDAESNLAHITVYLNGTPINTISYNGTKQVITCTLFSGYLNRGLQKIGLKIEDLSRQHKILLDFVDLILQSE